MKKIYTYIDIFAGCGGMSLGLYHAGWKGLFAIEKSSMAFSTLEHNLICKKKHFHWPRWLPQKEHDINTVIKSYPKQLKALRGNVDLVVGGPPCQGFSIAGMRNENDKRNKMIDSYIRFISLVKPKILFFENVKGFTHGFKKTNPKGEAYSSYVLRELTKLGYNVRGEILDFSEFGIPQRRKRFIIVGVRKGNPLNFFNKIISHKSIFLRNKSLKENITSREAISDLERKHGEIGSVDFKCFKEGVYAKPKSKYQELLRMDYENELPDSHRFPNHKEETTEKFNYILSNCRRNKNVMGAIKDIFNLKKQVVVPLDANKESPTLTTLPDDVIHYNEPRILTVREYARIQSFPDWFEFKGKYTTGGTLRRHEVPRYTQIGNAIPPLFGEQSGRILKEILECRN